MDEQGLEKISLIIQQHLQSELDVLDELDSINQKIATISQVSSETSRLHDQVNELNMTSHVFTNRTAKLAKQRIHLTAQIQSLAPAKTTDSPITLKQFIERPEFPNQEQLLLLREKVMARLAELQSVFTAQQATVFYSFDFYRRMINGLMSCDHSQTNYGANGRVKDQDSGTLIRRAC